MKERHARGLNCVEKPGLESAEGTGIVSPMKTITLTVDDEVYDQAMRAARQQRKSLGELFHALIATLRGTHSSSTEDNSSALASAWAMADSKPMREGSAGPLNRDDLYDRGVSGH